MTTLIERNPADSDGSATSSAVTGIVAIIAIVSIVGVAAYFLRLYPGQNTGDTNINVETPLNSVPGDTSF